SGALVGQLLLHVAELLRELVGLVLLLVVELLDPVEGLLAERRLLDEPLDVDHADAHRRRRGRGCGSLSKSGGRDRAGCHRASQAFHRFSFFSILAKAGHISKIYREENRGEKGGNSGLRARTSSRWRR